MTRVLIVEDSRTQAVELQFILETAGFTVGVATDGRQGVTRASSLEFDLVLSDVLMPELTGYELCRALKANPATVHIPVILLTTLNDPMAIVDALACGAENFIIKPFDADYLVGRVRDVLANQERRGKRRVAAEAEIVFLGKRITINSDKEQILDLLVSTFEDIVRGNRELEASQAALREADTKLREHSEQLARTNRELEAFTYTVSHDLKEPLRGIEALNRILQEEYASALDDQGRHYLDVVGESAVRLRTLIDDLLTFCRVGRQQMPPDRVDLDALMREVLATLHFSIDEAHASVLVAPDLPTINGHLVLLRELFVNLVGNALKYRRPDVAPQIQMGCRRIDPGTVQLDIADNGIGVPAEHRDRVFGLFQRLHGREDYPGTGVGLALCKRIVEEHRGSIQLDETPGGGCTVRFTLRSPLIVSAGTAASEIQPPAS